MFILDQLWTYDSNNMRLINRNGNWSYQDNEFIIPLEETEGNIAINGSKKVLGIRKRKKGEYAGSYGNKVLSKNRKKPADNAQIWLRTPIENQWFMLKNKANGRILAAKDEENTVVSGKLQ